MGSRKKSNWVLYASIGLGIAAIVGIVVALESNRRPTPQEELAQLKQSVQTRDPLVKDLRNDMQQSITEIANSPDQAKNKEATGRLVDRMQRNLDAFGAASLSEREKQCVKLLGEFAKATQTAAGEWQDVQIEMQADPVLAFPKKLSVAELDVRIATVERYIATTKKYQKFVRDQVSEIRRKMTELNDPQDSLGGYLDGLKTAEGMHDRALHPLLTVNVTRGETMLKILRMLRDKHDAWSAGFLGVDFKDDKLSAEYDALMDNAVKLDAEMEGLGRRVVEEMKVFGS